MTSLDIVKVRNGDVIYAVKYTGVKKEGWFHGVNTSVGRPTQLPEHVKVRLSDTRLIEPRQIHTILDKDFWEFRAMEVSTYNDPRILASNNSDLYPEVLKVVAAEQQEIRHFLDTVHSA